MRGPPVENWADKYKDSHHHTDRLVRTKVSYENKTGTTYPELPPKPPKTNKNCNNMAWGRGGSSNIVKVTTTNSRRAYSVPADEVSYLPASKHTASTVGYTLDDVSNLSTASRRQDQKLLSDITTRLANAPFTQPATSERKSRSRTRRHVPSAPGSRRGSVSSVHSVPRRQPSLADEEFEIVFPKSRPLPPCARRANNRATMRSSSLPPSIPARGFYGRGSIIDSQSPLLRCVDTRPTYQSNFAKSVQRNLEYTAPDAWLSRPAPPKRRYSYAFEEPEVSYIVRRPAPYVPVNVTRPVSYVPTTVPRPYVRRYSPVPRYSRGYEPIYDPTLISAKFRAASEPRRARSGYTPSNHLAVRQARECLGRLERELGMGKVTCDDDAPYIDDPVVTTTHVRPLKPLVARTGFIRGGGASPSAVRRGSYTYGVVGSRPPPVPTRVTRRQEIEARLETMHAPEPPYSYPASVNSLRSRTNQARDKMDQHKALLDRYLPCPTGPINDVPYEVEYKFAELAERMPQLQPRERKEVSRAVSLPPYRPVEKSKGATYNAYNDALRSRPFVPKVSDTRKRARDVLCRTKRDPHYFDY